ncbi:MAG: hypothetical protein PHW82_15780 [Bacteroidales bacterium]|nr:hypothetical protein [Bacteroidales bacterium]
MDTLTVKKPNVKATQKEVAGTNGKNAIIIAKTKQVEKVKPTEQEKPEVKSVETVEPIVKAVEPVVIAKPQLSLEQKIEKIENLKTLIEKREKLEASRKKLTSFVVGTNQFNENIVLTDENGNNFKTSNTEVFTKVVETINNTLISKITEIEEQIEF